MSAEDELAAIRRATRDLHEAIKDARIVRRELQEDFDARRAEVHSIIETVVKDGLAEFGQSLDAAIKDATERVYARFDKIVDILLGEDRIQRRRRQPSVEELIRARQHGSGLG